MFRSEVLREFWINYVWLYRLRQTIPWLTFKCRTLWHFHESLSASLSYFFSFSSLWRCGPTRAMASVFLKFLDHVQRRITVGRNPLDEWSARRGDVYLTTHNTHNRQTSMPPGGIRIHSFSRRAATDLRLRPRAYWDRHMIYLQLLIIFKFSSL